jgi:hypothetical protein
MTLQNLVRLSQIKKKFPGQVSKNVRKKLQLM